VSNELELVMPVFPVMNEIVLTRPVFPVMNELILILMSEVFPVTSEQ